MSDLTLFGFSEEELTDKLTEVFSAFHLQGNVVIPVVNIYFSDPIGDPVFSVGIDFGSLADSDYSLEECVAIEVNAIFSDLKESLDNE